ncbi:MAG TPA: glycosyltransferase family 2 protein [Candidatus Limnocylindrales bacterium]|nr:glycosyltransferase family 2 protein [Candidatus Limnocylindrales bacterium]
MTHARTVAVVLAWNDGPHVVRLLERLRSSSPPPASVVIVDNGSTDGTAAAIEREYPQHEMIALPGNAGFARAANAGIRRALELDAEWVWLLNTDIDLPGDALLRLQRAAQAAATEPVAETSGRLRVTGEKGRCGMVGAILLESDGSVQACGGGRVSLWTGIARHERTGRGRCDYLSGACLLLRADMLREIGLFDEAYFFYWEDIDLGFRARERGWTLRTAADCRVVHREGSSLGRWSEERWYHLFRGMIRFLDSRAPFPRVAAAARLLHHTATMLRRGRYAAIAGAWSAFGSQRRLPQSPAAPCDPAGAEREDARAECHAKSRASAHPGAARARKFYDTSGMHRSSIGTDTKPLCAS